MAAATKSAMKVLLWSCGAVGVVTVVYTISIFATYPIARDFGRSEQIFRQDRAKHNNPAPNTTNTTTNATAATAAAQPMLSISFTGPFEWNDNRLEEYQVYGVHSSTLGLSGLDAEQAATTNGLGDDDLCPQNKVAAKIKWRGKTKPPLKPSYKIKLYQCICEEGDDADGGIFSCEWKKLKLSGNTPQLGYTGNRTNKWTLRSDRGDVLNLYDQYATELFSYLGGRDAMWSRPTILKINGEEMGLYQFMTSPGDDILPFEDISLLFENDGGVHHR